MGIKLRALRRVHYPSGPTGREYSPGDKFEALSERDAKALTLIRAAEFAPESTPKPEPPRPDPLLSEPAVWPMSTRDVPTELRRRGRPPGSKNRSTTESEEADSSSIDAEEC